MLFPQAARPWEEGGKRRIAPALLIGVSPSSACARHLLVQPHLHESGGILLCLFLPVPPGLLSTPSTKKDLPHLVLIQKNGSPSSSGQKSHQQNSGKP
jgi:hypothetical protein